MVANSYPVPTFNPANFELESRRETISKLMPIHFSHDPREEERCNTLWAVEGILRPGHSERGLLAVNIGDVAIPSPNPNQDSVKILGEDIAGMLVSARMGFLAIESPNLEGFTDENPPVRLVLPIEARRPLYVEGMRKMEETIASMVAPAATADAMAGREISAVPVQEAA